MSKEIRRKELRKIDVDSIWTVVACHKLYESCIRDMCTKYSVTLSMALDSFPQVPNLHFKYTNLKVDPACTQDSKKLIKLFQNPALKSLTLEGMTFECFFPYLLEGLQERQKPLCSLSLLYTEIGKQPDKLIQRFFDVLYSSPLLSEFELQL